MRNQQPPRRTIRERLCILSLLALVPLAAALITDAWQSRQRAVDSAHELARREALFAADVQERYVVSTMEMLVTLAAQYRHDRIDADVCVQALRQLLVRYQNYANIGLLDQDGKLQCSGTDAAGASGLTFADRPYFHQARETRGLSVSPVVVGRLSKQRTVVFGYPRYDSAGLFKGIVFATLRNERFASLELSSHKSMHSRFAYFDRHGDLITTDPQGSMPAVASLAAAMMQRFDDMDDDPVMGTHTNQQGYAEVVATAPIRGPHGIVAYVQASIDRNKVLQTWEDLTWRRAGWVMGAVISGLLLSGWFLEYWLVRDFRRVMAFSMLASTNKNPHQPTPARTVEAEAAIRAVVNMAHTLHEQREQLSVLHIEANEKNLRLQNKQKRLAGALTRLENLSTQLVNAQEKERKHLARELHDELGQRLTALNMLLHLIEPHMAEESGQRIWRQAESEVALMIAQVRALSVSLRPPALDFFKLETAIQQLIDRQMGSAGIAFTFEAAGVPESMAESVEITAYRLVQEGLTNVLRHARASRVIVELNGGEDGSELEVVIRDNGLGFAEADVSKGASPGQGLTGMRERVELLGGSLQVNSVVGQGTRIVATLPLKEMTHETTHDIAG